MRYIFGIYTSIFLILVCNTHAVVESWSFSQSSDAHNSVLLLADRHEDHPLQSFQDQKDITRILPIFSQYQTSAKPLNVHIEDIWYERNAPQSGQLLTGLAQKLQNTFTQDSKISIKSCDTCTTTHSVMQALLFPLQPNWFNSLQNKEMSFDAVHDEVQEKWRDISEKLSCARDKQLALATYAASSAPFTAFKNAQPTIFANSRPLGTIAMTLYLKYISALDPYISFDLLEPLERACEMLENSDSQTGEWNQMWHVCCRAVRPLEQYCSTQPEHKRLGAISSEQKEAISFLTSTTRPLVELSTAAEIAATSGTPHVVVQGREHIARLKRILKEGGYKQQSQGFSIENWNQ